MKRALLVLLLGCTACASAPAIKPAPVVEPVHVVDTAAVTPDWALGAWPAHLPQDQFAAAVATSTDAATARAQANSALEVRVFGPPERWPFGTLPAELAPVSTPALTRIYQDGTITSVLVAADRAQASQRLEDWAKTLKPQEALPASTSEDERILVFGHELDRPRHHLDLLIGHLRHRTATHYACQQAPVRTSTCAAPSPRLLQDALRTFLSGVQMKASPPDGVPFRPGVGPLRPASVQLTWKSPGQAPVPLPRIPVSITVAGIRTEAKTGPDGFLRWPLARTMASGGFVAMSVDGPALLGAASSVWSQPPKVQVLLRTLDAERSRLALSIKETAIDQPSTEGSESLRHALTTGGLRTVYYLDAGRAPKLPITAAALTTLADEAQGQLDLIAVGVLESHFASQMGARSVWYEASGHLDLYDAWTGQRIAQFEDSARAVGIGERAAATAALKALGRQFAAQAQQAILRHNPGPLLQ